MANIIRALSNANYRLYFGGQIVAVICNLMQQTALSWLIYRLTDSTLMLGIVLFAGQIPTLLLAPVGGILSDRFARRHLLRLSAALSALQAGALAALSLTGHLQPPVIIAMAVVLGLISGVEQPIRQSFISELVERREDISNAIALNSFTIHSSRFIGPLLAGFLVATAGEAICFALNALSYTGVIWTLSLMRLDKVPSPLRHGIAAALREGVLYVWQHPAIRLLIFIVMVMGLFSTACQVLLPWFAREVFRGDVSAFGVMTAASGLGACLGTVFLASRPGLDGMERRIIRFAVVAAGGLLVFALTDVFIVALMALLTVGFGSIVSVVASNGLIQSLVQDHMRGRVMAIYSMAFFGLIPLGHLLVGYAARHISPRSVLLVCAAGIGLMALSAWRACRGISFALPSETA